MKPLLTLFIALVLTLPALRSEEPAKHSYQGEVTGVVCQDCSNHIKFALGKIPGVTSVKVLKGDKDGVNKLVIDSSSDKLTAEAANKALGEFAKDYAITSLKETKGS